MSAPEFRKPADIIREVRKPGKVYIGMLIAHDVVHVVAEKSDLIEWLTRYRDADDCGVYATRNEGALYIDAT